MYFQKNFNKYGAVRTAYRGGSYASKLEAHYAMMLDDKKKEGEIDSWEKQVTLDLRVNEQHICNYKIDFIVKFPDGHHEWVETKGIEGDTWRLKWKLLEATFNEHKRHPDDIMVVIKQSNIKYFKGKKI